MIKGFVNKETEGLWNRERSRAVPASLQRIALRKLTQLNNAENLGDLRVPPGNKLEKLSGKTARAVLDQDQRPIPGLLHMGER